MLTLVVATVLTAVLGVTMALPAMAQVCTPAQQCGDVNASGVVSIADALSVMRRSIGLETDLTCTCDGGGECPLGGLTESFQTMCWDPNDTTNPVDPIDCVDTGQDGDFRAGLTNNFVVNVDGTITDTRTTLMWEKLSDDGSIHDQENSNAIWDGAFDKIDNLNSMAFAGHSDWRLPNVKELQSIVNFAGFAPAVVGAFNLECESDCTVLTCSCTLSEDYWTSTTSQQSPTQAWFVDFRTGETAPNGLKTQFKFVRAVRGGY